MGRLGRIVTEWARRPEMGAEGRRWRVQGPAARTTWVAGRTWVEEDVEEEEV